MLLLFLGVGSVPVIHRAVEEDLPSDASSAPTNAGRRIPGNTKDGLASVRTVYMSLAESQ